MKAFWLGFAMFVSGMISSAVLLAGAVTSTMHNTVSGYSYRFVLQQKELEGCLTLFAWCAVIGLLFMTASILYDVIVKIVKK